VNDDILRTIEPKSDQLNADSLLGRTLTIKVTKVMVSDGGKGDQPVTVSFEADDGKPYKPCKSMRRVLVFVWGPDVSAWAGRSMTLYRDEHVMFAGAEIGGIRISHMSGIKTPCTLSLTSSRSNRKPYTVQPLTQRRNLLAAPEEPVDSLSLVLDGHRIAEQGMAELGAFWQRLTPDQKRQAGGAAQLESWKRTAVEADHAALVDPPAGRAAGVKDTGAVEPPDAAPASEIKAAAQWGGEWLI